VIRNKGSTRTIENGVVVASLHLDDPVHVFATCRACSSCVYMYVIYTDSLKTCNLKFPYINSDI
jgi:hypothetical protein